MTGMVQRATGVGELDGYLHDTVKYLGGMANKLINVATGASSSKESEESSSSSHATSATGALLAESSIVDPSMTAAFRTFEDLDMLESGFAREYISDECLLPAHSARRWMTCNVVKEEKTAFRMYLDDSHSRFLLSAKRIGDCFYISQYEAFPESVEEVPDCYFCAVLKTCGHGLFKLYLNGCEHCDKRTERYTCGGADGNERQLLAEIQHSVRRVKAANADMRCLSVRLPKVDEDRKTREVWCPRQDKMHKSKNVKHEHVPLINKLPEWNEELQSLVLRFNKGRVLAPSAKNFLLTVAGEDNKEGILQFGKTRRKRYALDFRHPISPVQAFGICLSLFNWNV